MNCLPCFGSKNSDNNERKELPVAQAKEIPKSPSPVNNNVGRPSSAYDANDQQVGSAAGSQNTDNVGNSRAQIFTFRELASATKNFKQECLLGESGYGKVYKGTFHATGKVVAVKQLDRHGTKANKEFLVEVMMLSLLHHPNLVDLVGYCADGEQRLLVYEYMPMGSLKDHLLEATPDKKPLDWITRMKIASGTAQAVEYLHDKANPPIIYRNLKSSNILLDENFEPKLTDYGLAKLEIASGNNMHQRVMSTYGCCAPEYERNGELTPKCDVYSFGIVLLELITGRRALDTSLPTDEQNLVTWAQPYFRDPKRFPDMVDPQLNGAFPERSLNQAIGVAAMCLQEEPFVRPLIADVVAALSFLAVAPPEGSSTPPPPAEVVLPQKSSSSSSSDSEPDPKPDPDSEPEPEQILEATPSHMDQMEDMSSGSDDEDTQSTSLSQFDSANYNDYRGSGSSSESLYHEDDYSEEESQGEGMINVSIRTSSRSKSRAKSRSSSKRKVMFEIEDEGDGQDSSKRSSKKSFKTQSISNRKGDSSLKVSSASGKSSRRNSRKIKSNSIKKNLNEFDDDDESSTDSNNKSRRRSDSQKQEMHSSSRRKSKNLKNGESIDSSLKSNNDGNSKMISSKSRRKSKEKSDSSRDSNSEIEYSDGSGCSISGNGSRERSISSNSKFSLDSRCYSFTELQDGTVHGSSSRYENIEE